MKINFIDYTIRLKQIDNQEVNVRFDTLEQLEHYVAGYFKGYSDGCGQYGRGTDNH